MNATIAKKTGAAMNRGSSRQDWCTPPEFLAAVKARFGFIGFDLAASAANAVATSYFTEQDNSLVQNWERIVTCKQLPVRVAFCNPPYSDIRPWAAKCEGVRHLPRWTLLLVPASVDAEWYTDHVHGKAFVAPLRSRIKFVGAKDPYPKSLMLAAYGFSVSGFEPWRWR